MKDIIVENFDKVIDHFQLSLEKTDRYYIGPCPIHGGDNVTAFNFYHTGNTTHGNWYCNTHQCHECFYNSAIGFIQALLSVETLSWSQKGDQMVSFADTIKWCEQFFDQKYEKNHTTRDNMTYTINRMCNHQNKQYSFKITQQQYIDSGLKFPDNYFASRGYNEDILRKFSIGYCDNQSKPMYGRAIVPLHDKNGDYIIGCSGRSVFNKCNICKSYHNPEVCCPSKDFIGIHCKWRHSNGFPGSSELYNFHRARKSIQETGLVIITEGPPNIWRLYEAGFDMSVSSMGAKFSLDQKKILDISGAHTIIIVPDADEASKKMIENIKETCSHTYNIVTIEPSYKDDIGACNVDTVKNLLSPFIEKYRAK